MPNIAGFQKTADNPNNFQIGVMVRGAIMGETIGVVAIEDIVVGSAVFIADYNPVLNISGGMTNTGGALQFGGVATRANTTASGQFYTQGYSNIIPAGQEAQVMQRGTIPVLIAVANEAGGAPKAGSVVWAMNNGTFQTQVPGTAVAGGVATNLRVMRYSGTFVANSTPVVITNVQNMGV